MDVQQHTPGPWSIGPWVDSMGGHVYRVISAAGRKVSGVSVYGKRSDGTVGGQSLKGGGHTKTVSAAECDANAALIAAAPDLLAALEDAADALLSQDGWAHDPENRDGWADLALYETYMSARAAIAKARLSQPPEHG